MCNYLDGSAVHALREAALQLLPGLFGREISCCPWYFFDLCDNVIYSIGYATAVRLLYGPKTDVLKIGLSSIECAVSKYYVLPMQLHSF